MERVKAKKYFSNFFLGSILFHLVLLALLNVQKVQKINFVKENFINLFPSADNFVIPLKEAAPAQNEAKSDQQIAPIINPDINTFNIIKEHEQENIIEKMPVYEKDLLEEQIKNKLLNININAENKEFADEIIKKSDISIIFGKNGSIKNTENHKDGSNSSGENIAGEFNRKKIPKDFLSERLSPNKPANMYIFERSNKITTTAVRIWLDSNGRVIKAEIAKSSGYIELDQLALNSIKQRYFIPAKDEPIRIAVIEIDFTNIR